MAVLKKQKITAKIIKIEKSFISFFTINILPILEKIIKVQIAGSTVYFKYSIFGKVSNIIVKINFSYVPLNALELNTAINKNKKSL